MSEYCFNKVFFFKKKKGNEKKRLLIIYATVSYKYYQGLSSIQLPIHNVSPKKISF